MQGHNLFSRIIRCFATFVAVFFLLFNVVHAGFCMPGDVNCEHEFTVTVSVNEGSPSFVFLISAAGTYYIDWGDGTSEQTVVIRSVGERTIRHEYLHGGQYKIGISGQATAYSTDYTVPAIDFAWRTVVGISGSLGAVFGTLTDHVDSDGNLLPDAQPSFYQTFALCALLSGNIPKNLFKGISGTPVPQMFQSMFAACNKLSGSIPENLFSGLSGKPASNMFYGTFSGCSGLTGPIPENLFAGIDKNTILYDQMLGVFGQTNLARSCPDNAYEYKTGFEEFFDGHVSCSSCPTEFPNSDTVYNKNIDMCYTTCGTDYPQNCKKYYTTNGAGNIVMPGAQYTIRYIDSDGQEILSDNPTTWTIGETSYVKLDAPANIANFMYYYINEDKINNIVTELSDGIFFDNAKNNVLTIYVKTAPFSLTTTDLADDTTFSFEIGAKGVFFVNWGDGSVLEFITNYSDSPQTISHVYTKAGKYIIGISGQVTVYSDDTAISFSENKLIAKISGSLGAIFGTITNRVDADGNLLDDAQPLFKGTFSGCTNLTGNIPENLFTGISGAPASYMFYRTFYNCSGLTGPIPENLFGKLSGAPASHMFDSTFYNCSGLTGPIPENLFGKLFGAPASYMFYSTFLNCSGLTGPIPSGLFGEFNSKEQSYMFYRTFYNCHKLSGSIPANLFKGITYNRQASNELRETFRYCSSLSGYIPEELFGTLSSSTDTTNMFDGTNLATTCPENTYTAKTNFKFADYAICSVCPSDFPYSNIGDNAVINNCYTTCISPDNHTIIRHYTSDGVGSPASCEFNPDNTYTVTYHINNGSDETKSSTFIIGIADNLSPNTFTPSKDYLQFKGWATTPNGAIKYTDSETVVNMTDTTGVNIDLYAIWGLKDAEFSATTKKVTANSENNYFTLYAAGTYYIDWGDSTDVEVIIQNVNAGGRAVQHKYTKAGQYVIGISGQATAYPEYSANLNTITKRTITFNNSFNSISGSLGAIFGTLPDGDRPNFAYTFSGLVDLSGPIPENLFSGITGAPTRDMFAYTFNGCKNLTGHIPQNLFSSIQGQVARGTFDSTFKGCAGLTGPIPENLFHGITGVATLAFNATFSGASQLGKDYQGNPTAIPGNLFANISGEVTHETQMFNETFNGTQYLTSYVPVNLFRGIRGFLTENDDGSKVPPNSVGGSHFIDANGNKTEIYLGGGMTEIFQDSNILDVCPDGMYQYLTGFEIDWNGRVACDKCPSNFPSSDSGDNVTIKKCYTACDALPDGTIPIGKKYWTSDGVGDSSTCVNPNTKTYTIRYMDEDGNEIVTDLPKSWAIGTTQTFELTTPVREGYEFNAWYREDIMYQENVVGTKITEITEDYILQNAKNNIVTIYGQFYIPSVFWMTTTNMKSAEEFRFSIANVTGDFYVDWGDGNVKKYRNSNLCVHKYLESGVYRIGVAGKVTGYPGYNKSTIDDICNTENYSVFLVSNYFANKDEQTKPNHTPGKLAKIEGRLGNVFPTLPDGSQPNFSGSFADTGLTGDIPEELFDGIYGQPDILMFNNTFVNNRGITGEIPQKLFSGLSGNYTPGLFQSTFSGMTKLSGNIPAGLFADLGGAPQRCMFANTFSGDKLLNGKIPETLFNTFDGAPAPYMFYSTFNNCSGLSDNIHADLFKGIHGTPAPYMFAYTFNNCSGLQNNIPQDLFKDISGTPAPWMFAYTFNGCSGLQNSIHEDLFKNINGTPAPWMFAYTFAGCSGLKDSIPESLFRGISNKPADSMFRATFADCTGLTGSIPEKLFYGVSGQPAPSMFESTFHGCTGLQENIPDELFHGINGAPAQYMFAKTFNGCSGLTGKIPDMLFGTFNNIPAPWMFFGTFNGCSGLTDQIPGTLFNGISGRPASGMFASTFSGCSGLSDNIPSDLFSGINGNAVNDMYNGTFSGCSGLTGPIPENLFGTLRGSPANYMFWNTFNGCSGLTGVIPEKLFGDISGNIAYYMFNSTFNGCSNLEYDVPTRLFSGINGFLENNQTGKLVSTYYDKELYPTVYPMSSIFEDSGIITVCPAGEYQYLTGFESDWSGRVACEVCPENFPKSISGENVSITSCFTDCLPKPGYVVSGGHTYWNEDGTGIDETCVYVPERPYTVTYDANGGTGEMTPSKFYYEAAQALSINTFVRSGYKFIGWSRTPEGAVEFSDGEIVKNLTDVENGNVVLYAQWITLYTITYDANGGVGTMSDNLCEFDHVYNLRKNIFTRENYVFQGWAKTPYGSKAYSDEESISNLSSEPDGRVTLYAVWASIYTVTYHANGGEGEMEPSIFISGVPDKLRPNTFTKQGHVFVGWAIEPDGSQKYKNEQSVNNLTTEPGGNIDLYAVWRSVYTVVYHANGGEGEMEPSIFIYDESGTLRYNEFFRTGYTFYGWTTYPSDKTEYYDFYDGDTVYNLNDDYGDIVDLYAVWNPNEYEVIFEANCPNSFGEVYQYMIYDESTALRRNEFRCGLKRFMGWSTRTIGDVLYTDGQVVKNLADGMMQYTVYLYAIWDEPCPAGTWQDGDKCVPCPDGYTSDQNNPDTSINKCYKECETSCVRRECPPNASCVYSDSDIKNKQYYGSTSCTSYDTLWCETSITSCEPNYTMVDLSDLNINIDIILSCNTYGEDEYDGMHVNPTDPDDILPDNGIDDCAILRPGELGFFSMENMTGTTIDWRLNNYSPETLPVSYTADGTKYVMDVDFPESWYGSKYWINIGKRNFIPGAQTYLVVNAIQEIRDTGKLSTKTYDYLRTALKPAVFKAFQNFVTSVMLGADIDTVMPSVIIVSLQDVTVNRPWFFLSEAGIDAAESINIMRQTNLMGLVLILFSSTDFDNITRTPFTEMCYPYPHVITYDANGGTGNMSSTIHLYDNPSPLMPNAFTRNGHEFIGWATTPNGSVEYADFQIIDSLTSDLNLYAVWSELPDEPESACPGGMYNNNGECTPCPNNTYEQDGVCEKCPDGYVSNNPNGAIGKNQCYVACTLPCTEFACAPNATCTYDSVEVAGRIYYGDNTCSAYPYACSVTETVCNPGNVQNVIALKELSSLLENANESGFFGCSIAGTDATHGGNFGDVTIPNNGIDDCSFLNPGEFMVMISDSDTINGVVFQFVFNDYSDTTAGVTSHPYKDSEGYEAIAKILSGAEFDEEFDGNNLWVRPSRILTTSSESMLIEMALNDYKEDGILSNGIYTTLQSNLTPETMVMVDDILDKLKNGQTISEMNFIQLQLSVSQSVDTHSPWLYLATDEMTTEIQLLFDRAFMLLGMEFFEYVSYYMFEVFPNSMITYCTPQTYIIKYNANGGSGTMPDSIMLTGILSSLSKNVFTNNNYEFAGWSTSLGGPVEYQDETMVKNLADAGKVITLYAVWTTPCSEGQYNSDGICTSCPDGYTSPEDNAFTSPNMCYKPCEIACQPIVCPEYSTCTQTSKVATGIEYYGRSECITAYPSVCDMTDYTCDTGYGAVVPTADTIASLAQQLMNSVDGGLFMLLSCSVYGTDEIVVGNSLGLPDNGISDCDYVAPGEFAIMTLPGDIMGPWGLVMQNAYSSYGVDTPGIKEVMGGYYLPNAKFTEFADGDNAWVRGSKIFVPTKATLVLLETLETMDAPVLTPELSAKLQSELNEKAYSAFVDFISNTDFENAGLEAIQNLVTVFFHTLRSVDTDYDWVLYESGITADMVKSEIGITNYLSVIGFEMASNADVVSMLPKDYGAPYCDNMQTMYNINYELNGGVNYEGAPTSYEYGVGAQIDGTPTKNSFAFISWCRDAELTDCAMPYEITSTNSGDITLYAKWQFICETDKWFHIGEDRMCLYSNKETEKTINFDIGGDVYYLLMSINPDLRINATSTKKLRMKQNGVIYNGHDWSVM